VSARKLLPVAHAYANRVLSVSVPRRAAELKDRLSAQHGNDVRKWPKGAMEAWTQMSGAIMLDELVVAFCAGFETAAASAITRDGSKDGPLFEVDMTRVAALGKELAALVVPPERVS
jgi:hypothetical protein